MGSTEIEKKSLEAHVELCAERYENLENKLDQLESRMDRVENYLLEIRESIIQRRAAVRRTADNSGQYKMLITIGTTIIGVLITGIITLIVNFVNK